MNISRQLNIKTMMLSAVLIATIFSPALAKDTDIYSLTVEPNCYILMDNSGSMDFGVYEHTIDYGDMFDYLFILKDSGNYTDYIYDTENESDVFHHHHEDRYKIFLWKGDIGVTIATVDGQQVAFTGDAAGPNCSWFLNDLVDTHTWLNESGDITDEGGTVIDSGYTCSVSNCPRITVSLDGYILLDDLPLPLGLDIKPHDFASLYDGTRVDSGFGGLLNAPGYYFSGYEEVSSGSLDVAENEDKDIYFFLTGNWVNMQAMYNLHYTTSNPDPPGASTGDPAWKFELFPIGTASWSQQPYSLKYPDPAAGDDYFDNNGTIEYENNIQETDSKKTIVHPGATQIQVHFSFFDVNPQQNDGVCIEYKPNGTCKTTGTDTQDFLHLYDANGNEIASYNNNDNFPSDGWSPVITGDTVDLRLSSGAEERGQGYKIDKIRVTYHTDSYLMQNRLDIAKDSISYVVDEFRGKMNWGFASFNYNGSTANGANIRVPLNPAVNDDANKAAIQQQIANVDPMYGTPLGEALQDIFEDGYYGHRNSLDNLLCRKNYTIVMTDGFPSDDDDWSRISGVGTFTDADGDGWTEDPSQYPHSIPPGDYYDDVAHWMYTHSWMDKSEVLDPESSYVNVITHHIAFGAKHPLLQDAAGESGGEYIAAYNKGQLVAAFYSLALLMSKAVSFTAPVVSVDAANKIQSGDDLYMGLFMPKDSSYWVGNLKKFRFGDGSSARPDMWMIYDGANNTAIDSSGAFLDNTAAIWADDSDVNDSDNYGAADAQEDGAGEVLTERVAADFLGANYYERSIYTCKNGNLTDFTRNNITPSDLGIDSGNNTTRDKIVNFIYGYTCDADVTTGDPTGVREWALGAIIHSRPVVIDYYDPNDLAILQKRYIAVGANDGMLHIFDDANGQEIFAFVPEDLLEKLQNIPANDFFDSVDGHITLYRRDKQPKYLIFGERRGGHKYWCLDISDSNSANWTVAWNYSNSGISQSWSEAKVARIQIGAESFKDVLIFTGGYDEEEDNYPEPFDDEDNSGSPFNSSGNVDPTEWKSNNSDQDINSNGQYDIYNPDQNEYGRGVFVVDIDNPFASLQNILPFSVTYGATNVAAGLNQTLADMKYCFPATPSIVTSILRYKYDGHLQLATNILRAIYAIDIYGNMYKITYDYCSGSPAWTAKKIFSANPGSSSSSGTMGGGDDTGDQGRKAFYPPAISWGGAGSFFDAGNYRFENTRFEGTDKIASLFVGTGDREHPLYSIIRNRFYAIYDDSSLTAETARLDSNGDPVTDTNGDYIYDPIAVSSYPYTEDDLLNLTCDELGIDTAIDASAGFTKDDLLALLRDDPIYDADTTGNNPDWRLEAGSAHENDAKGWYIILEDQGDSSACSHCTYIATIDASDESARDNHLGEKVLCQPSLYYKTIYFTTYQPAFDDPCNPQGNGFTYALNYETGSASLNLNRDNSSSQDITDRYRKYTNIYGIPSGFEIVTRSGHAAALASIGGAIIGGGEDGFEIPSPGLGLELFYWLEGNSEK